MLYVIYVTVLFTSYLVETQGAGCEWRGVSLAGAEFGSGLGNYGSNYLYPTTAEVDYFSSRGMNVIRLPFKWERIQTSQFADLDSTELGRMKSISDYIVNTKNMTLVLDIHNYARYNEVIMTNGTALGDFWAKLMSDPLFKSNPKVAIGIMNEPNEIHTTVWRSCANTAIAAIRAIGANNLILLPGTQWTGAHSWAATYYQDGANGEVMKPANIVDSMNNYAYEAHQYMDSDYSGTSATCPTSTGGSNGLQPFTTFLRQYNVKGFIGEFGASSQATCMAAITNMLAHMEANSDVYLGWAWWAAGPLWPSNYFPSIEPLPTGNPDRPQMQLMIQFMNGTLNATAIYEGGGVTSATSSSSSSTSGGGTQCTTATSMNIYTDSLQNGFVNYSWGTVSLTSTTARSGTGVSMIPDNYNAVYFHCSDCIDLATYSGITFWVNGGTANNQQLRVQFIKGDPYGDFLPLSNFATIAQNSWVQASVPFSAFGFSASDGPFNGFVVQAAIESTQSPVYFDDFTMVCVPSAGSSSAGNSATSSSSSTTTGATSSSSSSSSGEAVITTGVIGAATDSIELASVAANTIASWLLVAFITLCVVA